MSGRKDDGAAPGQTKAMKKRSRMSSIVGKKKNSEASLAAEATVAAAAAASGGSVAAPRPRTSRSSSLLSRKSKEGKASKSGKKSGRSSRSSSPSLSVSGASGSGAGAGGSASSATGGSRRSGSSRGGSLASSGALTGDADGSSGCGGGGGSGKPMRRVSTADVTLAETAMREARRQRVRQSSAFTTGELARLPEAGWIRLMEYLDVPSRVAVSSCSRYYRLTVERLPVWEVRTTSDGPVSHGTLQASLEASMQRLQVEFMRCPSTPEYEVARTRKLAMMVLLSRKLRDVAKYVSKLNALAETHRHLGNNTEAALSFLQRAAAYDWSGRFVAWDDDLGVSVADAVEFSSAGGGADDDGSSSVGSGSGSGFGAHVLRPVSPTPFGTSSATSSPSGKKSRSRRSSAADTLGSSAAAAAAAAADDTAVGSDAGTAAAAEKERVTHQAIDMLDKGKYWERCIDLLQHLRSEGRDTVMPTLDTVIKERDFYKAIRHKDRFFESYFFVEFYGRAVPQEFCSHSRGAAHAAALRALGCDDDEGGDESGSSDGGADAAAGAAGPSASSSSVSQELSEAAAAVAAAAAAAADEGSDGDGAAAASSSSAASPSASGAKDTSSAARVKRALADARLLSGDIKAMEAAGDDQERAKRLEPRGAFVFRGSEAQRLGDFVGMLKKRLPTAEIVHGDFSTTQLAALLEDDGGSDDEVAAGAAPPATGGDGAGGSAPGGADTEKKKGVVFLKIRTVLPSCLENAEGRPRDLPPDLPSQMRQYRLNTDLNVFSFTKAELRRLPSDDPARKLDEVEKLQRSHVIKTFVFTCHTFPTTLRVSPVTHVALRELSPIESATADIVDKNKDLVAKCDALGVSGEFKSQFTMALKGIIDAAVNGGTAHYTKAFLQGYTKDGDGDDDADLDLADAPVGTVIVGGDSDDSDGDVVIGGDSDDEEGSMMEDPAVSARRAAARAARRARGRTPQDLLVDSMVEQALALHKGLELHKKYCPEAMAKLHDTLEDQFVEMTKQLRELRDFEFPKKEEPALPPTATPSSAAAASVRGVETVSAGKEFADKVQEAEKLGLSMEELEIRVEKVKARQSGAGMMLRSSAVASDAESTRRANKMIADLGLELQALQQVLNSHRAREAALERRIALVKMSTEELRDAAAEAGVPPPAPPGGAAAWASEADEAETLVTEIWRTDVMKLQIPRAMDALASLGDEVEPIPAIIAQKEAHGKRVLQKLLDHANDPPPKEVRDELDDDLLDAIGLGEEKPADDASALPPPPTQDFGADVWGGEGDGGDGAGAGAGAGAAFDDDDLLAALSADVAAPAAAAPAPEPEPFDFDDARKCVALLGALADRAKAGADLDVPVFCSLFTRVYQVLVELNLHAVFATRSNLAAADALDVLPDHATILEVEGPNPDVTTPLQESLVAVKTHLADILDKEAPAS